MTINGTKQRDRLDITDWAMCMSEGNPGALSVLLQLMELDADGAGLMAILHLDDMNIRGSQIWIAYKDHCDQNIEVLAEKIRNRDKEMIATVNRKSGPDYPIAVEHGASYER